MIISLYPKCLDEQKVALYLSTPESNTVDQEIEFANLADSIQQLQISQDRKLYVIIHGYGAKFPDPDYNALRTLLIAEDHNVILVDWTEGSKVDEGLTAMFGSYGYTLAISNGRLVAAVIAKVLDTLIAERGLQAGNIHIVAHSLGAHVAGFLGARVRNIGSITGLDPASYKFTNEDPAARLDSTDATFVQVIHSSSSWNKGTSQRMGDVDFYANGGDEQPGCGGDDNCNHNRAFYYYFQSIENSRLDGQCRMVASVCDDEPKWTSGQCNLSNCQTGSCTNVGYQADHNLEGKYYFDTMADNTTSTGGYCGSQIQITVHTTSHDSMGTVELAFDIDTGSHSYIIDFWKFPIAAAINSKTSVIKAVPWKLTSLQGMYVRYGHSDWSTAPAFLMQELAVADTSGNKKMLEAPVTIAPTASGTGPSITKVVLQI